MTGKRNSRTDGPTLRLLAAGALVVASACAAPMLATETAPSDVPSGVPVRCGVATESHGGMTTFRPWVQLDAPRPARYSFSLRGQGTVVDQGGSLDIGDAGQSILGEASVTGPASGYDVELTVQTDGKTYQCHVADRDI